MLNYSVSRTVTLTADAALNATTLAIAAAPSAIPANTPFNAGTGIWFRTTASATSGATSLTVTAIPAALTTGATATYTQNRYVITAADAAATATTVAVVATGFALVSGDTAQYGFKYRHLWKNQKRYNIATFCQLIGDDGNVEVSPGAFANQLDFSVDYDMDTFVTPTLQGNALNQTHLYTLAETGLDVALTDNVPPFRMIDAQVVIDGEVSEDVESCAVSINRNAKPKGVIRRKRGVARHTPGITDISMTLNTYYTSDEFLQKYYGQAVTTVNKYGVTCKIIYLAISLEFASCPMYPGDLSYEWGVIFPKGSIETLGANVAGQDEIMQDIQVLPNLDGASGTDAMFYLVNDESLADIMTPMAFIQEVPANHVTDFFTA